MTFRIETTREGEGWNRSGGNYPTLGDARAQEGTLIHIHSYPRHDVRVVCNECEESVAPAVGAHECQWYQLRAYAESQGEDFDQLVESAASNLRENVVDNPRAPTPEERVVLERFETAFLTGPKEAINWFDEKMAAYEKDGWTELWRRPDPEYSATGGTRVKMVRRTEDSMMKRAADVLPDYSDRWTDPNG